MTSISTTAPAAYAGRRGDRFLIGSNALSAQSAPPGGSHTLEPRQRAPRQLSPDQASMTFPSGAVFKCTLAAEPGVNGLPAKHAMSAGIARWSRARASFSSAKNQVLTSRRGGRGRGGAVATALALADEDESEDEDALGALAAASPSPLSGVVACPAPSAACPATLADAPEDESDNEEALERASESQETAATTIPSVIDAVAATRNTRVRLAPSPVIDWRGTSTRLRPEPDDEDEEDEGEAEEPVDRESTSVCGESGIVDIGDGERGAVDAGAAIAVRGMS